LPIKRHGSSIIRVYAGDSIENLIVRTGERVPRDAGMTLAEILVAMAVTSVVMAVATTGMLQMYRASNRADVLSSQMNELQIAFQQLDRSVRYATGISDPNTTATSAGNWYVEWSSVSGTTTLCNQLRLNGSAGLLQRRQQPAGGQLTGWAVVASLLVAALPFTLQPASTSGYPHQRLTVDVTVRPTGNSAQFTRHSTFSFTALNTTLTTVSSGVCTGMSRP
jgi:prepilin-type N-terminal cleavage/methylation domain-containing protein